MWGYKDWNDFKTKNDHQVVEANRNTWNRVKASHRCPPITKIKTVSWLYVFYIDIKYHRSYQWLSWVRYIECSPCCLLWVFTCGWIHKRSKSNQVCNSDQMFEESPHKWTLPWYWKLMQLQWWKPMNVNWADAKSNHRRSCLMTLMGAIRIAENSNIYLQNIILNWMKNWKVFFTNYCFEC